MYVFAVVVGDGFIDQDITFRNTSCASNHQDVSLPSGSDLYAFYRCDFEGYQDTLYVHSNRQFYKECNIYCIVDFIFGNVVGVFQNFNIFVNTTTAQGRMDPNQKRGISIHNSRVTTASNFKHVQNYVVTYLGRSWKQYSRIVFMKTFLNSLIHPAGWFE